MSEKGRQMFFLIFMRHLSYIVLFPTGYVAVCPPPSASSSSFSSPPRCGHRYFAAHAPLDSHQLILSKIYKQHSDCALIIPGEGKSSAYDHANAAFHGGGGGYSGGGGSCITYAAVNAAFHAARWGGIKKYLFSWKLAILS